jgi:hypothetical protein
MKNKTEISVDVNNYKILLLAYRLYTMVPRPVKYIDVLTNWYVKLNKKRFKVKILIIFLPLEPCNKFEV